MAAKYCSKCERKFSAERKACPTCGALIAGPGRDDGSSRTWRAFVLAVALGAFLIYSAQVRETGPAPRLEALHSSAEAIVHCRIGIESRVADQNGRVQGSLEAEYLQGGEYVVRGDVSLGNGRRRVTSAVLCEAQFTPDIGWTIAHVEFGS